MANIGYYLSFLRFSVFSQGMSYKHKEDVRALPQLLSHLNPVNIRYKL